MRRRLFLCGLLLAALAFPALAGVATGLHLEWADHHRHSHHGPAAHHHPEPHTRLDHDHHSHQPVEPDSVECLLRPTGARGHDDLVPQRTTHPPAVLSGAGAESSHRSARALLETSPFLGNARGTLHLHCTLLL